MVVIGDQCSKAKIVLHVVKINQTKNLVFVAVVGGVYLFIRYFRFFLANKNTSSFIYVGVVLVSSSIGGKGWK